MIKRCVARRSARLVVLVVVVGGVAAGFAYATVGIPGSNGVIQGCYDSGGNLKVVASLPCPKGYTSLPWNQQGQPGTNGTNGTNGVSGYEIVTNTTTDTSGTGSHGFAGVLCPTGKKVLGGGGLITQEISNVGDAEILDGGVDGSHPSNDGTSWTVHFNYSNPDGSVIHIKVYATCATVN